MGHLAQQFYSLLYSVLAHAAVLGAVLSFTSGATPKKEDIIEIYMVNLAPVITESAVPSIGQAVVPAAVAPRAEPPPEVKPQEAPIQKIVKKEPIPKPQITKKIKPLVKPEEKIDKIEEETQPQLSNPDQNLTNQTALTNEVATTSTIDNSNLRLGQGGIKLGGGSYEHLVMSQLISAKRYPERARRRGLEGDVVLAFEINRDGSVAKEQLAKTCSSDLLNQEALAMIARAAPFPPPPGNYRPGQLIEFQVPIKFTLN